MKKIIRSRPMKLASNKKARSSGFMTSKSITRTATVPYLFIHGCRFMRLIPLGLRRMQRSGGSTIGDPLGSIGYRNARTTDRQPYLRFRRLGLGRNRLYSSPRAPFSPQNSLQPFSLFSPQCCACIKLESSDGRIAEFAMPRGRRRSRTFQGGHSR
jgi:hypothetical protein